MEQKKTLWIIAASGVFLLVVIGAALLLACLSAMREEGYGYAVIGSVGPADFYKKICGAVEIEGSSPGVYRGMLRG